MMHFSDDEAPDGVMHPMGSDVSSLCMKPLSALIERWEREAGFSACTTATCIGSYWKMVYTSLDEQAEEPHSTHPPKSRLLAGSLQP